MRAVGYSIVCTAAWAASLAAQPSVEFEGRYWIPQLSARIRVEQAGFGTDIDAKRDLGIPDTNFPGADVTFRSGRHMLEFAYTPIDLSGDQNASRTVVFRGRQYTVGTRVISDLEVRHLQFRWAWQFLRLADGRFRLGPMLEADGFLLHGRLAAPNLNPPVLEQEDLSVGLPAAGLALDVRLHRRVNLYGRVAGMEAGDYGYFVGSDVGVKVTPWRVLSLMAGYRTFNLHVEDSPDFARLQLRGPVVGAGFRF